MMTEGVTQSFSYSLSGLDPACSSGAGSAANSCGVHIHTGMTCSDNAGGHYFTGTVTADPWTSVSYTADAGGAASGVLQVTTGALGSDVEGRALIVHGFDGGRIGCALLAAVPKTAPVLATGFVPYYTYTGNLVRALTLPTRLPS